MFQIKGNSPIPLRSKYPWDAMKVGDFFDVSGSKTRDNALRTARSKGITAASRKLKGGKYRLWRAA